MIDELNYIDGEWVESTSDSTITVLDPSYDQPIGTIPDSSEEDVDRAVTAARRAFDEGPWPRMSAAERRAVVLRLGRALEDRAELFGELIPRESGCPTRLAGMMQVAAPISHVYEFAEHARLVEEVRAFPVAESPSFGQSEVRRDPVGVCAGFSPFNFPLFMSIWKTIPAAAMGNTVVLKPSPITPLATAELIRACEEAGFPPGVINVVNGDRVSGEALVRHAGVDRISFTGSTAVGSAIMSAAANTTKRLTLELGGKSPSIILDDANLELAVQGTLFAAFMHAGQACVATTRLLVPGSRYDEIVDLVRERANQLKVGVAEDPVTDVGPLVSERQLQNTEAMVERALGEGAKVLTGGKRADVNTGGFFYEPTVLVDVEPGMEIACEEVFGPVLTVQRYETEAQAVAIANGTQYGLGAAVWGDDLARARSIAARMQAGTVWINDYGVISPNGPFGGYKRSGFGRELSPEGSLEYTELKHVYTALDQDLDARSYGLVGLEWS